MLVVQKIDFCSCCTLQCDLLDMPAVAQLEKDAKIFIGISAFEDIFDSEAGCLLGVSGCKFYSVEKLW